MSETRLLLAQTVEPLFAELATASDRDAAWQRITELGIHDVFLAEEQGGFGGNWQDAWVVLREAGFNALGLPVADTMVARRLLAEAGIAAPDGAIALAPAAAITLDGDAAPRCSARLDSVAWAGVARFVLTASADTLVLLDVRAAGACAEAAGAAGEPRADIRFDAAPVLACAPLAGAAARLHACGALARAAQMAGALAAALAMSVAYVNDRVQFGRSLSKFQAIQHQMALLAEEAAAVDCATRAACLACDEGDGSFAIACAKLRANRAVQQATSIAHQVHGAIGITHEHRLHHFTQRLWQWRSDFGNDRFWAGHIGRQVIAGGANGLWPTITG